MASAFLDDLAAKDTGARDASARGSFLDSIADEDDKQVRTGTPAIEKKGQSKFSQPFAYFDPEVRRAAGIEESSLKPLEEVAPGINQGVAHLLGLPVTTLVNAANLASAGMGYVQSKITGEAPSQAFDPVDPATIPLSGAWNEQLLNSSPLGDVTSVRDPSNPVARVVHNTAAGIPGGMVGGGPAALNLTAGAAGGGAQALLAEAGADPATQAVGSLLAGYGAARGMSPGAAPSAPIREEAPAPSLKTGFERENMGAASAAMDLTKVSPNLRGALEQASQDGSLNREVVTRHIEADSLPIPMRLTRGQATQDPSLLSKEQNLRGTDPRFANDFKQQNQQLIDNLDEIRATAAPNVVHADPVQSGQALLDAYKQMDAPVRAEIDAKYQAMRDAAAGDFPIDTQALLTNVRGALKKDLAASKAPSDAMNALEEAATAGKMDFETFEQLRTSLARIQRASADGQERHAAGVIREQLEELPLQGSSAELKKLADEARRASRERFARINSDPAYKAAVNDDTPVGELSPLADNFVDKFVVKGKAANLQTMQKNLAGDATAKETIAAGALNYLKSKSGINGYTNEGNFSQHGYNKALAELTPKLQFMVPAELADQIQALGNVARYTQAQPRGSFVNNSNTFVAAAAEKALPVLEGVLNVHAGGLPVGSYVRKKVETAKARKFYEESTAPAAGVKLNSILKPGKKE